MRMPSIFAVALTLFGCAPYVVVQTSAPSALTDARRVTVSSDWSAVGLTTADLARAPAEFREHVLLIKAEVDARALAALQARVGPGYEFVAGPRSGDPNDLHVVFTYGDVETVAFNNPWATGPLFSSEGVNPKTERYRAPELWQTTQKNVSTLTAHVVWLRGGEVADVIAATTTVGSLQGRDYAYERWGHAGRNVGDAAGQFFLATVRERTLARR